MKPWQYLLLVALAYGLLNEGRERLQPRWNEKIIATALATGGETLRRVGVPANCYKKNYCISVFVHVNSGLAKASEPTFQAFQKYIKEKRPDIGFGLILSGEDRPLLMEIQKNFETIETLLDEKNRAARFRRVGGNTAWVVTDANGETIFQNQGALIAQNDAEIARSLISLAIE